MSEPRIDVIVIRDPNYETVTEIYIDGKPATGTHIWDFYPGAGMEYEDYADQARGLAEMTAVPQAIKARLIAVHRELLPIYRKWSTDRSDWPQD